MICRYAPYLHFRTTQFAHTYICERIFFLNKEDVMAIRLITGLKYKKISIMIPDIEHKQFALQVMLYSVIILSDKETQKNTTKWMMTLNDAK